MSEKETLSADEFKTIECDEKNIHGLHIKHFTIDFGECSVYGQYTKKFPLEKLQNTESICYAIMPDQNVNPIYSVFNFNKYEGVVKPGESLKLKVTYIPTIPYLRNVENFEFVDSSFNIMKIKVVGECIGPILKASVKRLHLFCTTSQKSDRKTVEFRNISDVPAEFKFDYKEENSVFRVEPRKGSIKGQKHIFVYITFTPKEHGVYSQELFCLIWGGMPVVIRCHGIYKRSSGQEADTRFQSYSLPAEDTSGYRGYMRDCPNSNLPLQAISMSRNYIDFGRVLKSHKTNTDVEIVTMKNILEDNIVVKWPDDEIFKIVPIKADIPPNAVVSFRCMFHPDANSKLYSKILTGQIKWMPKLVYGVVLPIAVNMRLQGHSFPENQFWIPNVEVSPQTVTLPICLPEDPSYTTFKITVLGHLPVIYRLIPPKKTNFTMKPMVGLINTYEIVVAQLYSEGPEETKQFKENWYIELNGLKEKRIPLSVRGEVSIPKILVGENNTVKFEPNQPGCESVAGVTLKNTSCFQIKYKFENKKHECLEMFPQEGILPSNDELLVKFVYTGNLKHPKELQMKCKMQRIKEMRQLFGSPYSHTFTVITDCRYQQLCSTPKYHNFGKVQLDTPLETEFYVFNFGTCTISFVLNVTYNDGNLDRLKVEPLSGDTEPREKTKIRITGFAKTLGDRTIRITYRNNTKEGYSEEDKEEHKAFEITYSAVLPILQIGSIIEHNFGLLFSKRHLWGYLNIEELNDHLRNMLKGEKRSISVNLPEVQVKDETYFVTLEMENKSIYEMDVSLKRKQLCDCSLKEVSVNINTTKKEFECIHRKMLRVELAEPKFYKDTQQLLTVTLQYLLPGETNMCYIMELPHGRSIELTFHLFCIPPDTAKISSYTSKFLMDLKNISVRRKVAPIQTFWFYNNTGQPATYQMDTKNLLYLCQSEGFEVLTCINPEGTIDPYKAEPLMIRFQPIEIKEYIVQTSLTCSDGTHDFIIKGSGQRDVNKYVRQSQMPNLCNKNYYFPIIISHNFIPINLVPIWSTAERVIFIKNTSKDKMFLYFWEEVGIKDIVEITATNKSGILQPQESQAVVITIKTFNESCMTYLQFPCHFLDYTQLKLHQTSLETNIAQLKEKEVEDTTVKHPKPFTKTVIISFHIIHTNDRDNFFTMEEQFQSNPQDEISINISNLLNSDIKISEAKETENKNENIQSQDKVKIQTILEQLIADFVFSNSLQEVLEYSNKVSSPVYKQFTLDERKIIEKKETGEPLSNEDLQKFRLEQIKKLFSKPKPSLVGQVVKNLIVDGIHDTFRLGVFKQAEIENVEDVKSIMTGCPADYKCENARKKCK